MIGSPCPPHPLKFGKFCFPRTSWPIIKISYATSLATNSTSLIIFFLLRHKDWIDEVDVSVDRAGLRHDVKEVERTCHCHHPIYDCPFAATAWTPHLAFLDLVLSFNPLQTTSRAPNCQKNKNQQPSPAPPSTLHPPSHPQLHPPPSTLPPLHPPPSRQLPQLRLPSPSNPTAGRAPWLWSPTRAQRPSPRSRWRDQTSSGVGLGLIEKALGIWKMSWVFNVFTRFHLHGSLSRPSEKEKKLRGGAVVMPSSLESCTPASGVPQVPLEAKVYCFYSLVSSLFYLAKPPKQGEARWSFGSSQELHTNKTTPKRRPTRLVGQRRPRPSSWSCWAKGTNSGAPAPKLLFTSQPTRLCSTEASGENINCW